MIKNYSLFHIDIDECSNDILNNCEQICRNTLGNYTCDCHSGYTLNDNQVTCKRKYLVTLITIRNTLQTVYQFTVKND